MAYCTISEVRGLNPKWTYDTASKPTVTQVLSYISQIAAEIDTVLLGRSLTTPVTEPAEFVLHLKQVNAYGAAALAALAMFPEGAGPATPHGQRLWNIYKDAMKHLGADKLPFSVQAGTPSSFFEQHTGEPTPDESWRQPKFGKNKDF